MTVADRPAACAAPKVDPVSTTRFSRTTHQLADVALGRVAANEPVVSQVFVGHQAVEDVEYGHKDRVSDSAGRPGPEG
jgi:hypothetical protein